ncbi:hypothetical protein ACFP63_11135 [Oerskovia jenensis]|uniref:DUF3618 domain-containing protein n=1 Tax=Oerskovia jenensis TaxID=162169 RepID=A0ABS2LKG4_9CELL|nr:hypothetical protein [Oerskovia jenensis]MBM7480900.1 hypothetical protein [Oerskovia jenensis]
MSTPEQQQAESVPVTLARLEGKVDAALAVQTARLEEHARRLDASDRTAAAHSVSIGELEKNAAAGTRAGTSGWTIASVVVSSIVGLGSLLAVLLTLVRVVPGAP